VPICRFHRRIPARQFRRFPSQIPCPNQCLFADSAIEFLQDRFHRFLRRIPCPSQCLFAASVVEFQQDSFTASAIKFLVQVSAYSPPPPSNSCKTVLPLPPSNSLSKSVPIRHFRRRIPARQFRRFRHRIPCPSQCLFAASAVEFLQDIFRRFCRQIPYPSQCLFTAFVVEFLQDSFAASAVEFLVQGSAYLPLPSSNSCKPSQRSQERLVKSLAPWPHWRH
jgi:hypothetical protein